MAGVLDSVNQRTQLVGQNRLELLLFRLRGKQMYGINVFKVREVLNCPRLFTMPKQHRFVRGVAHIRGASISIIDLGSCVGMPDIEKPEDSLVIITEYNMKIQGFLVDSVDRIINKNWESVLPPPKGSGSATYLTAVTHHEDVLIEILDVEKILSEIAPVEQKVSDDVIASASETSSKTEKKVLIVDDSSVARKQIQRALIQLNIESDMKKDGKEALNYIRSMLDAGKRPQDEYFMIICDVEMPEMDGYTFTAEMKGDPRTADMFIMMHTSLSGVFNLNMVKKVGADDFLPKFKADELAARVASLAGQA
ncbi:MAG: two-component system chemotaxis response regulator CheV [Candidatus Azotimanducaceae bacterium]|jgi:two-component system chemotaxis response regulator CheV